MSIAPPVVDANGDINVHGQEGATILIDLAGVSASQLSFVISGQAAIIPQATSTANEYKLVISKTNMDAIVGRQADFALLLVGGDTPVVYWEGTLHKRGF